MDYMEIALLPKASIKIKGKQTTFVLDPQEKTNTAPTLLLHINPGQATIAEAPVVITGPGEYEIGGVKVTGTRNETDMLYSMKIDGIDILFGQLNALDKMQHKLKEHNIIVSLCDTETPASFLTSLAANVVMVYGDKAETITQTFGKDNIQQMTKYSSTLEKLPSEVETILLQ